MDCTVGNESRKDMSLNTVTPGPGAYQYQRQEGGRNGFKLSKELRPGFANEDYKVIIFTILLQRWLSYFFLKMIQFLYYFPIFLIKNEIFY